MVSSYLLLFLVCVVFFFFQAEDGIRDWSVTGVQTCALPICHHAPAADLLDGDERVGDPEPAAGPPALGPALDALDDDVGPEPAPVHAERCDRAVGRDEQREHVEPLASVVARESRVGAGRLSYGDGRLFRRPRPAVEPRLAVRAERRVEREQPRMGARGDHPAALVTHVDDPIADDPVDRELRALETLAGERLHRIAPELGDAHHRLPDVETRRRRGGIQWIGEGPAAYGSRS